MALRWSLAKRVQRWPEHHWCWSSAAYALYTAADLLVAPIVCFSLMVWGSDAGLVTVEGCDVEHVAVCANPDRLHLSVSGQGSRVGGAARAKNLKCHNKHKESSSWITWTWKCKFCQVDITHHTLPQLRQWCFLRMTVKGALQAMQMLQASSGTQSGGSTEWMGGKKLWVWRSRCFCCAEKRK